MSPPGTLDLVAKCPSEEEILQEIFLFPRLNMAHDLNWTHWTPRTAKSEVCYHLEFVNQAASHWGKEHVLEYFELVSWSRFFFPEGKFLDVCVLLSVGYVILYLSTLCLRVGFVGHEYKYVGH
jgi:hypothetical protein